VTSSATGARLKAAGFVVHPARAAAAEAAGALGAWLEERGVQTRTIAGDDAEDEEAARAFARGPDQATAVLERMLDGSARIEERLAVVAEGSSFEPQWALNEVIVEKSARHRLIRLAVFVDDAYVTTFSADGVISATPTGSTAYSFSAGGPIVSPSVPCIVVTPIAAHMVFDRSLVLAPDQRVRLEVLGEEPGLLSADGRHSLELPVGSMVQIERAPTPARFVRREDAPSFHDLVRDKFDLPGNVGGAV
jgi:NAD+ kinase